MGATRTFGVVGYGHLGRLHAEKYRKHPSVGRVLVTDLREDRQQDALNAGFVVESLDALLKGCDGVSICTPTGAHAAVIERALDGRVPVLSEKPFTGSVARASELVDRASAHGIPIQVGMVERFNPAIQTAKGLMGHPGFAEIHRMGGFSKRSLDIGVIMDLMIHDLDLLTLLLGQKVEEVQAVGVPVLTSRIDICNARLLFESGCVANVTASRISLNKMRKLRFFQEQSYLSIDCEQRSVTRAWCSAPSQSGEWPEVQVESPEVSAVDPLQCEIDAFVDLTAGGPNPVPADRFVSVLELAQRIEDATRHSPISKPHAAL